MKVICIKRFHALMLTMLMLSTPLYVSCGDDDDAPDSLTRDLIFAFSDNISNVYSDGTLYYYLTDEFAPDYDMEAWICGMEPSKSKVVIPSHVRYQGKIYKVEFDEGSFQRCTNLKQVTIPNTITIIWGGAFTDCTNLTSVNIPNSIIEIRDHAFRGCTKLKTIELGNSLKRIEDKAFASTGLESIAIPQSVTEIGRLAFYDCQNLKSMIIPKRFENELDEILGEIDPDIKVTFI